MSEITCTVSLLTKSCTDYANSQIIDGTISNEINCPNGSFPLDEAFTDRVFRDLENLPVTQQYAIGNNAIVKHLSTSHWNNPIAKACNALKR